MRYENVITPLTHFYSSIKEKEFQAGGSLIYARVFRRGEVNKFPLNTSGNLIQSCHRRTLSPLNPPSPCQGEGEGLQEEGLTPLLDTLYYQVFLSGQVSRTLPVLQNIFKDKPLKLSI